MRSEYGGLRCDGVLNGWGSEEEKICCLYVETETSDGRSYFFDMVISEALLFDIFALDQRPLKHPDPFVHTHSRALLISPEAIIIIEDVIRFEVLCLSPVRRGYDLSEETEDGRFLFGANPKSYGARYPG